MTVQVLSGDCRDVLATMDDGSVDSVVCDPPYELSFMGKKWDGSGVAYDVRLWVEVLRVLKPGGHLLAFGGTRTYHRMVVAIEDAGFEVRDSVHWLYGSGFPKSLDVSKAIDKAAGAEREMRVNERWADRYPNGPGGNLSGDGRSEHYSQAKRIVGNPLLTSDPATDAARQWEGWGTALKPAHEPIVVARKPLVGTVAGNVLAYGTGALNIDGCRVAMGDEYDPTKVQRQQHSDGAIEGAFGAASLVGKEIPTYKPGGRWPANLVFTHAADCEQVGAADDTFGGGANATSGFVSGYESGDGFVGQSVTVPVWRCADGCPVAELDGQSGVSTSGKPSPTANYGTHHDTGGNAVLGKGLASSTPNQPPKGDSGGASRFFTVTEWDPIADVAPFRYVAKPSKRERNAGLDGLEDRRQDEDDYERAGTTNPRNRSQMLRKNHHPTVKPVALMRWLVRLVTPPLGTVLDPFAGSGTTLVAAVLEGLDAIGIEMTDDYLPIIEGRIAWAEEQAALTPDPEPTLFDGSDL